jgi:hypothetical protein
LDLLDVSNHVNQAMINRKKSSHPFMIELTVQIEQKGRAYRLSRLASADFEKETNELFQYAIRTIFYPDYFLTESFRRAMIALAQAVPMFFLFDSHLKEARELLRKLSESLVSPTPF